jgi:type IV secretion system protein VirB4
MAQARKKNAATTAKRAAAYEKDLQALRDIADDVIESDFVPYACLIDPDTLITKNGEVLQIIKITSPQVDADRAGDLRSAIRSAIRSHIPDASFAIWLHTVRRRQAATVAPSFPDGFSRQLDAAWRQQQPASAIFINELTISIVKAGESAQFTDIKLLGKSLLRKRDRARRVAYIEQSRMALIEVTENIIRALSPYHARRLTMVERDGVFYGEHIEFLEKLINLEERPMPMPQRDLSHVLTSGDITFGYNAMEVRNADGTRRFAALMTIKEYKESTLTGIDKFLEIPCEFIITQAFDFIGAERAREAYEKQAEYLRNSGDKELAKWMEIDRLSGDAAANERGFGQQQTLLFLIAASVKQLEANIRLVQKAFSRLGIIAVREDLRIEECYWAQLPGNFPFLTRHQPIDTQHLAGFANLRRADMGNNQGSEWGLPVTMLRTLDEAAYYFNFQRQQRSHTLLIGRRPHELASVAHFLLAQARKLSISIWYLDGIGRGSAFCEAMGGSVAIPATPQFRLNPLQLSDTPASREFLAVWLSTLVDPRAEKLNRATLDYFQSLVAIVMQMPLEQRRLSSLLPIVRADDAMLASQLQRWCVGGALGELFDMPDDQFSVSQLHSWNIAAYAADEAVRIPLVGYLLYRITAALTGNPTLIVLNDALPLLDTPLFSARVPGWLDFIASNNAACIALCSDISHAAAYPYARTLATKAASIFVLPDAQADAEYMLGFDLNEADMAAIVHMNPARSDVLMKRGTESTILQMDMGLLGPLRSMLAGDPPAFVAAQTPAELLAELMGTQPVLSER